MGSFLNQSNTYNIKAENELAIILSQFDSDYIMNVMEDILNDSLNTFEVISKTNIVNSYEENFKQLLNDFPEDRNNILQIRQETYYNIISNIASRYNFIFNMTDDIDLYSTARIYYDFFISNMNVYMIQFLADVIIKENQEIFTALNMDKYKKDKDITTIYNKMIFDNPNLITICSHIDDVLMLLRGMDFSLEQILNTAYLNNINIIMPFLNNLQMNDDFFKTCYCKLITNPSLYPLIITYLKLEIQRRMQTSQVVKFNI